MTKTQLARRLAVELDVSTAQARVLLDVVLAEIARALESEQGLTLTGFGTFEVRERGDGVRRNPRTGERVEVSARRTVVFRASTGLRERVAAGGQMK